MKLVFSDKAASEGSLLRYVTKDEAAEVSGVPEKEFSGAVGATYIHRNDGRREVLVGVGAKDKLCANAFRRSTAAAVRKLSKFGETELSIEAGTGAAHAQAIVEGVQMGSYTFQRYKSRDRAEVCLNTLTLTGLDEAQQADAEKGRDIGKALNIARDLGNIPSNLMTPSDLAGEATKLANEKGAKVRVWDEDKLKEDGFGGILAVGAGSVNKPRFILMERELDPSYPTIVIVGKSITFDSGGLSIKPAGSMPEMKFDMMGGAASLGIFSAICDLELPINIVVTLCSAENMLGSAAYRPCDVITNYAGKTIEVLNTDAEGRIVLSDGLSYVHKHYPKADLVVDLATLTGACVVALGLNRTGVFTKDDSVAETFVEAGCESGDLAWRLPMGEDYADMMKSRIADIANAASQRWGGASTAAAFLEFFAEDLHWVHLDIAGPANLPADKPEMEQGAAAAGVRLVVETLRRLYGDKK